LGREIGIQFASMDLGHFTVGEPECEEIAVIAAVLTNLAGSDESDFGGMNGEGAVDF
jgi:hypothetical protein